MFSINGAPRSWEQDAIAACLWGGEGTAISHKAAARLWGLSGFGSAPVEISTIKPKRNASLGFAVHRVRAEIDREISLVSGIPVTAVRCSLLDLAGIKHPRAERALDQALSRDLTSLGQMWLLYEQQWTKGRRGIAIVRSWLQERTPGNAPDDSELERLLDEIIRDFELPEPTRQLWVELPKQRVRIDYAYPEAGVLIEADSYAWHSDRPAFDADRERDNQLQLLGWRVLRFTWAELRFEPEKVASMIRDHLALPHRVVIR